MSLPRKVEVPPRTLVFDYGDGEVVEVEMPATSIFVVEEYESWRVLCPHCDCRLAYTEPENVEAAKAELLRHEGILHMGQR
jgi:hypothetical protein